jgi:hypothetical protein
MSVRAMKNMEEQLKTLFASHPYPPIEVIIPILEEAGRGEQELTAQIYDTDMALAIGIKEILGLRDSNMKTLAKVMEVMMSHEGQRLEPIELSESRLAFSISDCPMLHVGKDVSLIVKSRFCDFICISGSRALMDAVLGGNKATCSWDKALIKGARKCKLVFESVNPR